ncbi:hypothetical protein J7L68_04695 [bacterium]|nr:hypothetical protein [bacterium]
MRRFLVLTIILFTGLLFAQGIPHLIYGTAQNADGSTIPTSCASFIAYQYPAGAETLTQDSDGSNFDSTEWAIQIADLDLSNGDTLVIWFFNTCNGETALVLVEIDMGLPAQDIGMVTLMAGLPVITVNYPDGGESFMFGDPINIQWTASPAIPNVNIYYSSNGGTSWNPVASGIASVGGGNYLWHAPSFESSQYLVKIVSGLDTSVFDVSDGFFEVVPNPEINLTSPIGGEHYYFGDAIHIAWIGQAIDGVDIYFSSNSGTDWTLVDDSLTIIGAFDFPAPDVESSNCIIRAWANDDHSVVDMSGLFTIEMPPDTIPPADITTLFADSLEPTRVFISWTITGDDEYDGIASVCDLRFFNSTITEVNWDICTPVSAVPVPETSGTVQGMWVEGLVPTETYYFACKVADEMPNWSGLSNVIEVILPEIPDTISPSAFDFTVDEVTCSTATISWFAPGDDDTVGIADHYEFRYADFEIDSANFSTGTLLEDVPAPALAGTEQFIDIIDLEEDIHYWVAGYAFDDVGNGSPLALIDFTTDTCPHDTATADTIAPARITSLACSDFSPSGIQLTWMAPGDDGFGGGRAASYEIRYATHSFYSDDWDTLTEYDVGMFPHNPGVEEYYWVLDLDPATEYWFAIFAIDDEGNRSQMSVLANCITMGIANPIADTTVDEDNPDFILADLEDVFVPSGLIYSVDDGIGIETYFAGSDSTELWIHFTPDYYGSTYVYIYAYHGGNIVGDSVNIMVEHENDAPFFTCDIPESVAISGVPYNFDFTAEDADGDSIWFLLIDGLDSMFLLDDGTFLWMPPWYLGEGHYDVTIGVTDGMDTTELIFPVNIMKITDPIFAPINLVAYSGYLSSIPLLWDRPEAIDLDYPVNLVGYEIYRSTEPDSGFVSIGTSEMNTYNDASIDCGYSYYYTVRAVYGIPDAHSSQSNVAAGACNDASSRVYSAWVEHPAVIDGYLDDSIWTRATQIEIATGETFCFVNTADRLYGYIRYTGAITPGTDFSFYFDDDNSDWWDGLPSDEGRCFFRFDDEIGNYFQPVADVGGTAARGTSLPMYSSASAWRITGDGVILEFSLSLDDDEHISSQPGDSLGFMLDGMDSMTTYFAWTSSSSELDPATYGTLVLGSPGGIPDVVVYPSTIELTIEQGSADTVEITLQNLGDAQGYFEITGLPEWISSDVMSGYLYPMEIYNLGLIVSADMDAGDYDGEIHVYTTSPTTSNNVIEVILHITPAEPSNYLVISVPSVTYATDAEVEVPVNIGDLYDNDVTRIRFTVSTDPDIVLPTGVVGGAELPGDWTVYVSSIGEGHVTVELSGTEPLPISGEVARITYSVSSSAEDGYATNVTMSDALVNSGNPIPILSDGILVIGDQVLPYWSAMIYLETAGGARLDSASFGLHPLATDDYDRVIDRIDPPPMPDCGNIYFVSDDSYHLMRDLRHLGDRTLVYPLVSNSDGKIQWDINRVWSGCFIGDTLDMKSLNSVDITAGDTVYIYYHYISPYEITIELVRGWNLISLPFGDDSIVAADVLPDLVGTSIFYFDQTYGAYNISNSFKPGQAYWIFNGENEDYTISGNRLLKFEKSLLPGWFMLGVPSQSAYWIEQPSEPSDAIMRSICLGYDSIYHSYYNSNILKPGAGYWIFVLENCTFKVSTIYLHP